MTIPIYLRLRICVPLFVFMSVYASTTSAQQATDPSNTSRNHTASASTESCLEAARKNLGLEAEVLKCGHLTGADALEAVAAVRIKNIKETGGRVAVSKLAVLLKDTSQWKVALTADSDSIRNSIGYVGVEIIDDSAKFLGYRVEFSNHRDDNVPGFTIYLNDLHYPDGLPEGVATEISWNPSLGRFQEFDYGGDPPGFKPEIKSPKHIRTGRSPG